MPKNKFQDVIFTAIMATIMVYGMIVYNVALNMGGVRGETFIAALHEMPIMVPIAFILEFFVVGKLARMLAFTVMRPDDRPQFITYAISICICCIMCGFDCNSLIKQEHNLFKLCCHCRIIKRKHSLNTAEEIKVTVIYLTELRHICVNITSEPLR